MNKIQAIRGMNDLLPTETKRWAALEQLLLRLVGQYGYKEIRFPIVESTKLFVRSIGDSTDIVDKEMYTFEDRSGDSLTLRPEGTASCIRAGIEHGLFYHQIQRLCYYGPMFRHERPQKGRYRQFHQFGVEAYGISGPEIDLEILLLARSIWQQLGMEREVQLQINTLGDSETRVHYRQHLVDYFLKRKDELDEDSLRRLEMNPLRILDSKNPALRELIAAAPVLYDYLTPEAKAHFDQLRQLLDALNFHYIVNFKLVRGLDYYNRTVFEWVVPEQGERAQNTVCAGGHYDHLVENLGGTPTPAIGFAIGLERLLSLLKDQQSYIEPRKIALLQLGNTISPYVVEIAEELRHKTAATVVLNPPTTNLSTLLKQADKNGADLALIIGSEEISHQTVVVKHLREATPQQTVARADLLTILKIKEGEDV